MIKKHTSSDTWRKYQRRLRVKNRIRYLLRRLPRLGVYAGSTFLVLVTILYGGGWIFAHLEIGTRKPVKEGIRGTQRENSFSKKDLSALLQYLNLSQPPETGTYSLAQRGEKFIVETSIEPELQDYVTSLLSRSKTDRAAVVVLKPDTGRILALAQYEKQRTGGKEILSLKAEFPAASLFKIVSAAAAIEAKGFTPDRTLAFRGKKHTLYKSQLRKSNGRYTVKTNLKKAFSGSINPVFGKIGIYDLGKDVMKEYADKFLFNQAIPFDLPMDVSTIQVPEDDFGLAEIASGFNKKTVISPLHAALITAAVANDGDIMAPWLVAKVRDHTGRVLYRATPSKLASPLKPNTAGYTKVLMRETVVSGTSRKAFRRLRRDKKFKNVALGAKTGTINDEVDQYKYDWITAYALPGNGDGGICITILAVHGKLLGIRASELAGYVIKHYFSS
jgi:membrane peptidoglycan carboxypeptidase